MTGLLRSMHRVLIRLPLSKSTTWSVISFSYSCSSEYSLWSEPSSTTTCILTCLRRSYAEVMDSLRMCASLSRVCLRLTLHTRSVLLCSPQLSSLPTACASLKFSTTRQLEHKNLITTLTPFGVQLLP